ncbi:cation diffusion facilitator family transporter [Sulfurisphaera javensis]|uniref:Cation diffusion facilitator family transporter n=1 Tax=Sulfurisphaera javensis TaxID=2049879 RepID=A0AAT9GNQ0_9CREN
MKRAVIIYWIIFVEFLIPFILGKNIIALAEGFHDLIDAVTVTFSYYVTKIANISSSTFTYGLHRLEVFSAIINSVVIIVGALLTLYLTFLNPIENYSLLVAILSLIAIFLLLTIKDKDEKDLNKKSVITHALFDVLAYVIGIIILLVYYFVPYTIITIIGVFGIVILSIVISMKPLKQSFLIILEGSTVNTEELEKDLKNINSGVHHIHVWAICGHIKVATIHVEVDEKLTVKELDKEREKIEKVLREKYDIDHITVQFESKRVD